MTEAEVAAAPTTEEPEKDIPSSTIPSTGDEGSPALVEDEGDRSPAETSLASAPATPSETEATESKYQRRQNPYNNSNPAIPNPLPSIEECLFGIPRDLDKTNDEDEESYHMVPLNILRRVSSQGIDDDDENSGSHRGLTWRLLLGYLPPDRRKWEAVAAEERKSYTTFVQELFHLDERDLDGSQLRGHHAKRHSDRGMTKAERRERRKRLSQQKKKEAEEGKGSMPRSPIKFVDGPQSPDEAQASIANVSEDENDTEDDDDTGEEYEQKRNQASVSQLLQDDPAQWNMSVREQKILERLTNHEAVNQLLVKRDCKEWNNFLENATLLDEIRKDVNRTHPHLYFYLEPNDRLGARRYAALERILFVWAKLNKGVRYVQGMNEIVGTLYYVLANDFNEVWADHAEADTYILFNIIMSEMRDIFVADMDLADTGLGGRIENLQNLLHLHDPQVKNHLVEMGIDATFYAVRWLTTLLSREFLLPDTIRLWDSMFASTHKENFLRYVCVTMVLKIRDQLLLADFPTCLGLLQKYPSCSMDDLLDCSRALWIYESQITMACLKGGLTLHQALQAIPPPEKIIIAFGLRGGVALTNREQLEQAGAAVKNRISNASQGIIGGARRFLQGRIKRSKSSDGTIKKPDEATDNDDEVVPDANNNRRIPFRHFSFGGRVRSDGNEPATEEDIEKNHGSASVTDEIPPLASDAETV